MISGTWNGWSYNDAIRAIESYSCRKPGILFCAPELEPLIDAANAEFDPAARERKLQDLLARYHDLAPTLYLFAQSHIYAHAPTVAGLSFRHDQVAFENMALTRP
jgi:ABC-type transport system substrate-binding protein